MRILAAAGAISRTRGISPQIRHSFAPRGRPSGKHLADAHSRMMRGSNPRQALFTGGDFFIFPALDVRACGGSNRRKRPTRVGYVLII